MSTVGLWSTAAPLCSPRKPARPALMPAPCTPGGPRYVYTLSPSHSLKMAVFLSRLTSQTLTLLGCWRAFLHLARQGHSSSGDTSSWRPDLTTLSPADKVRGPVPTADIWWGQVRVGKGWEFAARQTWVSILLCYLILSCGPWTSWAFHL